MAALVNEAGGVLGRQIQVLKRDDESTPAVGVSRANEMIAEKVAVMIEGWNSPVTLAMQPVIARADILDITAVSKADPILVRRGQSLAVRMNSSNGQDGAGDRRHTWRNVSAPSASLPHPERRLRQRRPGLDRGGAEGSSASPTRRSAPRSSRSSRRTSGSLDQREQAKPDAVVRSTPPNPPACRR